MPRTSMKLAVCALLPLALSPTAKAAQAEDSGRSNAGLSGAVPSGVLRDTLPNGLRVVIVPDRLAPVVTTELNYLAGSNDAPAGFPGTAHALEHMMFRGSAGLDKDQLADLGARLGGVNNASTTETVTQYTYTVPAADLKLVLKVEALRMRGLTLDQAEWEKERGAIDQEVSRDLSSPFYLYQQQTQSILFAGTPYEHDALGTRESFAATDAAMLRQFYDRWYAPNNAILVIAGDVEPQAALDEVRQAFAGLEPRKLPPHPDISAGPIAARTLTLPTNFPVGIVSLAYRMPGLKSADFAAADILGDVLGSQRYALYGLVPDGRALMAQFDYRAKPDVGFGLALAAFPSGGDPAPLLADLRRVLADARDHGVPGELVEAARRQEIAQLAFSADSIKGLADSWSEALADQGADSPEDRARAYAAVTVEQVNRLARALLDPSREVAAVLTPRGAGAPPPSQGGFGGGESFASPPDHPVTLPDWAAVALASIPPQSDAEPPSDITLPNGLRLIVQPEHVGNTISLFGRVRGDSDLLEPAGQEGVAALTEQLFGFGSASLDRLALRKAVDDLGARESAGGNFQLRVLTPQFLPGLRLLAEHERHPAFAETAFPDKAFAISRRQLAQSFAGRAGTPDYLFARAAQHALVPEGDPSLREATADSVGRLTLADVRTYYAAAWRPELTTIVVIGDITPAAARAAVMQAFGDWQAEGPTPTVDPPPIGPNQPSRVRIADSSSVQDNVDLTEAVGAPVNAPDRWPLLLGNVILGDGFSSRLYRDLRVHGGLVYSVSSGFDWSRTRSFFSVRFGADADRVAQARDLVLANLRELRMTPVSQAELTRAKAELLRWLPMQRASVGALAGRMLHLTDLGLPLEPPSMVARHFVAISAEDIRAAFAEWLRPDDLAEVVKGPPLDK